MKLQKKLETGRNLSWLFNAQAVIQHFLLTLILILTFHEASGKKWKKSLIAFQCQGCDKMFSSWIHFVLIFYEASEKTGN